MTGTAPRPAHQLTLGEVGAWLVDSVVKTVTFHRTDPVSARDITEHGVDLAEASADGAWGRGFYSSTVPDPQYGSAEVPVAVRLRNPLLIHDPVRDAAQVDDLLLRSGTEDMRAAILSAGYDGVVIHYAERGIWVVAYFDEQVKVVVGAGGRG